MSYINKNNTTKTCTETELKINNPLYQLNNYLDAI